MDLIFEKDSLTGKRTVHFCTLNDEAFVSNPSGTIVKERFGIRMYPWTVALLTKRPLNGTKNGCCEGEDFFPALTKAVLAMLEETTSFSARCILAESIIYEALWQKSGSPDCLNVFRWFYPPGRAMERKRSRAKYLRQFTPAGTAICLPVWSNAQNHDEIAALSVPLAKCRL